MARPKKHREISCDPSSYYFKPAGISLNDLEEVILEGDELEAIRLSDFMGLSQEDAAVKMNISRATFGRIVNKAREKVADSIINGKAIKISDELSTELKEKLQFFCPHCGLQLRLKKKQHYNHCPKCSE